MPATNFVYSDTLHLTAGDNGNGGKVIFNYETTPWYETLKGHRKANSIQRQVANGSTVPTIGSLTIWSDTTAAPFLATMRAIKNQWAGLYGPPSPAGAAGSCLFGGRDDKNENILCHNGAARPERWVHKPHTHPGHPDRNAAIQHLFSQWNDGGSQERHPRLAAHVLQQYLLSGRSFDQAVPHPLPSESSKTARATITNESITNSYTYDNAATNTVQNSYAIYTSTDTTRYNPAYAEFRGHGMVREAAPDGRITTSFFHQDDARKGANQCHPGGNPKPLSAIRRRTAWFGIRPRMGLLDHPTDL